MNTRVQTVPSENRRDDIARDTQKTSFHRARDKLQVTNIIGIWNGRVHDGTSGQGRDMSGLSQYTAWTAMG
jgi:hypothetical protein